MGYFCRQVLNGSRGFTSGLSERQYWEERWEGIRRSKKLARAQEPVLLTNLKAIFMAEYVYTTAESEISLMTESK